MLKKTGPYLFILPALIVYLLLTIYPSLMTFYYSFTNYDGILPASMTKFVGWSNYKYLFTQDSSMLQAINNNIIWLALQIIVGNGIALLFAILLNSKIRGKRFFRSVFFAPVIISSAAVSFVWGYLLDPQVGDINKILISLGLEQFSHNWLGDPNSALLTIISVDIWKSFGFNMVIFLAALQTIPRDLYEACTVDGANQRQTFTRVTLPMLLPTLGLVTILTTNGTLRTFDMVYILTGGGPGYSTEVIMTRLFAEAFRSNRMGYGSAVSIVLFLILLVIAFIQLKSTEQKEIS
ncbi:carbohydrate ABC transporter permease [Cohnella abietis]|uniref:Sugar ABC transporter permease n=1 Tax=Cohnella abietis TaxID=2507935 RepID=A0A3T1DE16_9BACL|nr:sugar ABC transporter permease [Cohnella abietis]BBI36347.1 sugar ABC transporter permease [Cohnella abietis]